MELKGIPSKCLKTGSEECKEYLANVWNEEIVAQCHFPDELKLADVTPIFKKNDPISAKNYRPVSVLPTVSKVFERIMQKQIVNFMNAYLSLYLCGYRKGFSTQTALLSLLEKWKKCLDKNGYAAAVLMDLSKAFDTINHELLIAKLHAYGFSKNSLTLIRSYLRNRLQHVKINKSFSSWSELLLGVPQGSVLGPLLFNIYLNDLFFMLKEIEVCNFADDTTPFVCDQELFVVIEKLEKHANLAIVWFENNFMKLNTDKCHLLVSGHKFEHVFLKVGEDTIWESDKVKLLGITIDKELKFDEHVSHICLKANQKLSVLSRMCNFLSLEKRRIIYKSFIESQFKYCPLVWFFHSRTSNNRINKLHERALRLVYGDYNSTFETLLEKDNSFTIHFKSIQKLAIEIYKCLNGMSVSDIKDLFPINTNRYKDNNDLMIPSVNTELKGKNSLRYLGPVIWNSIPSDIRNVKSLSVFESKIKQWKPDCPCRLCKSFVQGVGFSNIK